MPSAVIPSWPWASALTQFVKLTPSNSTTESFLSQFDKSRAEIKRLKVSTPSLFPQYHELQHAEQDLERAKARVEAARQKWSDL